MNNNRKFLASLLIMIAIVMVVVGVSQVVYFRQPSKVAANPVVKDAVQKIERMGLENADIKESILFTANCLTEEIRRAGLSGLLLVTGVWGVFSSLVGGLIVALAGLKSSKEGPRKRK